MVKEFLLRRFTDYYDIKNDVARLNSEIRALVQDPLGFDAIVIKSRFAIERSMYDIMWLGVSEPISAEERIFDEAPEKSD